ncbi:unnamed protein product [Clonostachys chloroleuca]|uniref:Uncharacterized protein n=1 Tax=Clonostachys chloroleuca TaxID=1926264 RepID=A0AA35LYR9_9HYPO|nr:unnamed protein product [Clonostachys chloroleuca]
MSFVEQPVTITGTKYTDSTTRTSLPFDVEDGVVEAQANGTLKRGLKNRHMQMIANGGAIEAGLFVGSGGALYKGGLVITRNLAQFG